MIKRQQLIVGTADLKVSADPDTTIITYGLGSCIAVIAHDPRILVGGILHYQLPATANLGNKNPARYANTGIPLFFHSIYRYGSKKRDLVVKVVGGSYISDKNGIFDIGKRNYLVLKKMLYANNMPIVAANVGGNFTRTVMLNVGTGEVILKIMQEISI